MQRAEFFKWMEFSLDDEWRSFSQSTLQCGLQAMRISAAIGEARNLMQGISFYSFVGVLFDRQN
jgi:hypothetical protein